MTQMQHALTADHSHSYTQDKLEESMHLLSRVYSHLQDMGETITEVQHILNVEMDEVFTRRMKGGK